jgi:hypothetical protein
MLALLLVPAAGVGTASAAATSPQIKHFFIIVLENKNAENTFSEPSPAPYLGTTMREAGAFIPNYYGIGHASLDNYLAMISGQPPNLATQADCLLFTDFALASVQSDGVAVGQGCVYPAQVKTVADQLETSGHSWRGYMQDMANSVEAGQPGSCRHPAIGAQDMTQAAGPTDQYATRHDPFVYFHSIIDQPACHQNVVDLNQLQTDLASEQTTPEYAFITPDLCADGHDASCADLYSPGGFAGIDAFLSQWVPRIVSSPAYQDHGAILATFDESEHGAESCCNEPIGPNTLNNGGSQPGNGGGRTGAVILSPCVKPGTVTQTAYNHFSMLRWVEDNFGLPHLADAGAAGLSSFGADVFTQPNCPLPVGQRGPGGKGEMRLKVRPRRPTSGRRTTFKLTLLSASACIDDATVSFAGHRRKLDAKGKARFKLTLEGKGKRTARAISPSCGSARAKVALRPPSR